MTGEGGGGPREWWGHRPVVVAWSDLLCDRRELYAVHPRWIGAGSDEDWQRRPEAGAGGQS